MYFCLKKTQNGSNLIALYEIESKTLKTSNFYLPENLEKQLKYGLKNLEIVKNNPADTLTKALFQFEN